MSCPVTVTVSARWPPATQIERRRLADLDRDVLADDGLEPLQLDLHGVDAGRKRGEAIRRRRVAHAGHAVPATSAVLVNRDGDARDAGALFIVHAKKNGCRFAPVLQGKEQ